MDSLSYGNFEVELDDKQQPLVLGRGTFGSTYLARHRFLDTLAALKVINERFAAKPDARKRFLSEARSVARLDHRYIARVQDFGEAGGVLFYAMEYCAGGTLEERVARSGATPLQEWILIARQVADALVCCHEAGFIHRDLKPSNLMLSQPAGPLLVKLIDFGLVYSDRKSAPGEGSEAGLGSPLYASPEQLREDTIDAKSDLFSLGMSLWHLAAGAPPDIGATSGIVERRLSPESYESELPAALPSELRRVLAALLEKKADRRPASAAVFLEMLDAAVAKLGIGSNQAVPGEVPVSGGNTGLVRVSGEVDSMYNVVRSEGEQGTGLNYVAEVVSGGGRRWLHVLHSKLWECGDFQGECLGNVAKLQSIGVADLLIPEGVTEFLDHAVVVSESPEGVSLLGELKSVGKLAFADTADLLHRIARACDACAEAGVPSPELHPSHVYCGKGELAKGGHVHLKLMPRFASGSTAQSAGREVIQDASATMAPEDLSDSVQSESAVPTFARLVYRMTAGRDCVAAASLSVQAYVAVPEISEEGNRFLAQVIAGKLSQASCGALLSTLLASEGVALGRAAPSAKASAPATSNKSDSGDKKPAPADRKAEAVWKASTPRAEPPTASKKPSAPAPAQEMPAKASGSVAGEGGGLQSPVGAPAVAASVSPEEGNTKGVPSKSGVKTGVIAAVLAVAAVAVGAVFFKSGSAQMPGNAEVEFSGDLPEHSRFKVNGASVVHRRSGELWVVPVAGAKLPVEVAFEAQGYDSLVKVYKNVGDLKLANKITAPRSKGTLVFKPTMHSDYDHFSVEMEDLLPEDAGVGLKTAERGGDSLRELADTRFSLPTGRYTVILGGAPSVVSGFVIARQIALKGGEEVVLTLPQTYAGHFRAAAGQEEAELKLERDLRSGELVFQASGLRKEGKLRRCKLDNKGIMNAEFMDNSGGVPSDLTARLGRDGGVLELSIVSRGANSTPQVFQLTRIDETK